MKANESSFWKMIAQQVAPSTRTRIIRKPPPEGYTDENHYGQFTNIEEYVPGANMDDPETLKGMAYAAMASGVDPKDILNRISQLKQRKDKLDMFRATKAYQQAEMAVRPIVEKYGGRWDDSKYYWQNYNNMRNALDDNTRQQFDTESRSAMIPTTSQDIKAGILKKYKEGGEISERERDILGSMVSDRYFNMALKTVQSNIDTRFLTPEEQIAKAEELARNMMQKQQPQERKFPPERAVTGSAFDYLIDRKPKARAERGVPEGAELVPNAKTKDGKPVYRLKDGRFATFK